MGMPNDARVSTVISIYISLGCVHIICLADFFVFMKAIHWESRHQDVLMGGYTHRQKRKEVTWPEIPQDFDGWALKKRRDLLSKGDFMFGL
jgi:hypothetical protein